MKWLAPFLHNSAEISAEKSDIKLPDMQEVIGQEVVKRAALIAAAGGHHLLMIGPPGTGKSMIAKRIPGILPDLCEEEIIDKCLPLNSSPTTFWKIFQGS